MQKLFYLQYFHPLPLICTNHAFRIQQIPLLNEQLFENETADRGQSVRGLINTFNEQLKPKKILFLDEFKTVKK